MPSPLAEAHIEAQRRLRAFTSNAVRRYWDDLPAYDRANVDEFLTRTVPTVIAAQRQSVAVTEAYIARYLRRQPLGINPEKLIGASVRNGTAPEDVYQRPFVTLWTRLGDGSDYADAFSAAVTQAAGSAAMDVQLSMRATANAVQEADAGIYGYSRVADGAACLFCMEVDGAYVKSADAMPLHNNCGCGLEPLTAPHPRAATLPSGVAVHQHGELGPVLGDPAHNFTSAADIPAL